MSIITAYTEKNCKPNKKEQVFVLGNYSDLKNLKFNDTIRSIYVKPGFQVTVYDNDNYRGTSAILTGTVNDLSIHKLDKKITSLKVEKLQPTMPVTVFDEKGCNIIGSGKFYFNLGDYCPGKKIYKKSETI